jgi:hypothetical protein
MDGYNGRPRASGSPQKSPKFASVLGQTGRCTCPFLRWVAPLGAGFVRKDPNGRFFAFGSAPLEMPLPTDPAESLDSFSNYLVGGLCSRFLVPRLQFGYSCAPLLVLGASMALPR